MLSPEDRTKWQDRIVERLHASTGFVDFVDSLPDALVATNEAGTIMFANSQLSAILGYSQDELIGSSVENLLPEEFRKGHVALRESYTENPHTRTMGEGEDLYALHKSGRAVPVEVSLSPFEVADGSLVIACIRDVSRRKQTEEALRQGEALLAEAERVAHLAHWDWHVTGDSIYWSKEIYRIIGRENEATHLDYESVISMTHPEDVERLRVLLRTAWRSDETTEGDYRLVRPSGEVRYIHTRMTVARDSEQKRVRLFGTVQDVTERKEAEIERARLEAQVQHAQKLESLGVLAGGIAHDFNNLLTGVLGNAGLAYVKLEDASPIRPIIREIETAARSMADLSHRMLAYSGRGHVVVEPINLSDLVEEMTPLLHTAVSKKIVLDEELDPNGSVIEGDLAQLKQVVMNLITNASEAIGEEAGVITLRTGRKHVDRDLLNRATVDDALHEGEYVFLEVSDTGCGMDNETKARLFDPFFTTKFAGRGLGMAALLGIVRGHDGGIAIETELGKGTSFILLFPPSDEEPIQEEIKSRPASVPETDQIKTVLVVEDETSVQRLVVRILEIEGYDVLSADNGEEGLAMFIEHRDRVDAVLLDLTMPIMDGAEVLTEIRRMKSKVPVVLTSGYTEQEVRKRIGSEGHSDFIHKPFTRLDLLDRIEAAFAN